MCIVTWNLPAPTRNADGGVPPRLLRAYQQTRYVAGGIEIRIGRRNKVMDAWLAGRGARSGVLLTAWNPRSRRMPPGWNARMQRRLRELLHRVPSAAADGAWRRWHEEHLLVMRPTPWAVRVAARFRQCGVVAVQRGRPARLIVLHLARRASG